MGCDRFGVRSQWWCDLDVGDGAGVLAAPLLGCDWFARWVTLSLSLFACLRLGNGL